MGKLPHKNLCRQRISNSNYSGLLLPTKINPLENLTHEIKETEGLSAVLHYIWCFVKVGVVCTKVGEVCTKWA